LLGSLAKGLAILRSINATEGDARGVFIVQDVDRVTVEGGDDGV
jgi:hypothetical protein